MTEANVEMSKKKKKGEKTFESESEADGAFMWRVFESLLHLRVCVCTEPQGHRYFLVCVEPL